MSGWEFEGLVWFLLDKLLPTIIGNGNNEGIRLCWNNLKDKRVKDDISGLNKAPASQSCLTFVGTAESLQLR